MKLKNKLAVLATSLITTLTSALAHSEQDQGYYGPGMMWNDGGSWMHNTGHMMGYNMWGMGWFGLLFGLAFWILVVLGIIYLYQEITENKSEETSEEVSQ